MPEIELNRPCVPAVIRQLESATMPQPMGTSRCDLGLLTQPDHEFVEPVCRKWCASFGHEDVAAHRFLFGLEFTQSSQLSAGQGVVGVGSIFGSAAMDQPPLPVDVGPLQPDDLS